MFNLAAYALSLQSYMPLDLSLTHAKEARSASLVMSSVSLNTGGNYAYVLREVEDMLLPIRELRTGWHGPRSIEISEEVVERTYKLASRAALAGLPVPEVTPNPHGTITLEWEAPSASLSLEVGRSKAAGYLRTEGNDPILIPNANDLPSEFFAFAQSTLFMSSSFVMNRGIERTNVGTV
jgi:hypothetical protein